MEVLRRSPRSRQAPRCLQLYTGLVFEGPKLIGEHQAGSGRGHDNAKAESLAPLIGRDADRWADREL